MIPVSMTQQNGRGNRLEGVRHEVRAEEASTGTAIEDQSLARAGDRFHARRVAAKTKRARSGRGNRSPGTPEPQPQLTPPYRRWPCSTQLVPGSGSAHPM